MEECTRPASATVNAMSVESVRLLRADGTLVDIETDEVVGHVPPADDGSRPRDGVTEVNGVRLYATPGGSFPSVTSILSATKPQSDRIGLAKWRKSVGAEEANRILLDATTRGTAMHGACEDYMRTGAISSGPWWDSIYPFMKRVTQPELIEARIWHPRGFAGSLDLCACVDGEPAVIDFKTARKRKRREWITDYCLQVAAYVAGVNHVYRNLAGRTDRVRKAWITVAYVDAPADEFELSTNDLLGYYQAFCERLDEFNAKRGTANWPVKA